MKIRTTALIVLLAACALLPAQAATAAERAALSALTAYMRSHGTSDIEQPDCYVVQTWAFCRFGTDNGDAEAQNFLRFKNGKWIFLGQEGG